MANEQNLKKGKATRFHSGEEAAMYGSKGGKARAKNIKEKKTIQKLLTEILESKAKTIPQVSEIAASFGIEDTKNIKNIYTVVAVLNTLKSANLDTLGTLAKLLGEEIQYDDNNKDVEETLAVIKECAYADRDKP